MKEMGADAPTEAKLKRYLRDDLIAMLAKLQKGATPQSATTRDATCGTSSPRLKSFNITDEDFIL
eukprot:15310296-Heterocapsa_arctica.AAC.1